MIKKFVFSVFVLTIAVVGSLSAAQAQCAHRQFSPEYIKWAQEMELLFLVTDRPVPTEITESLKLDLVQKLCAGQRLSSDYIEWARKMETLLILAHHQVPPDITLTLKYSIVPPQCTC